MSILSVVADLSCVPSTRLVAKAREQKNLKKISLRYLIPGLQSRVVALTYLLIVLQVLDGLLTAIGVGRYGFKAEGNPIIRELMFQYGAAPVLFTLKLSAILIVILLAQKARQVKWVPSAMGAISCFYIVAAIAPWTYLLFVLPAA